MAKIIFSIEEVVDIIKNNYLLPEELEEINITDKKVSLKCKGGLWIFKIPANMSIEYLCYEDGVATFVIDANPIVRHLLSSKIITRNPDILHLENPKLQVDINKLLKQKFEGVQIENIVFEGGNFIVTTCV